MTQCISVNRKAIRIEGNPFKNLKLNVNKISVKLFPFYSIRTKSKLQSCEYVY